MGKIIKIAAIAAVTTFVNVHANELSSARALGMGGAMTALADGVDAARYNPANIGLTENAPVQIEIISLGVNLSNNAFTLDDYNTYSGTTLSASDKTYILGQIPAEGWKIKADASAATMSIGFGKFVFSVAASGSADANLNKDLVELVLNGNSFPESISVEDSYSDGIAYGSAGLSFGQSLYKLGNKELAIGATFRYLHGIATEKIVKLDGISSAEIAALNGSGELVMHTASGGSGYALDFGAAFKMSDNYSVGLKLENVLGSIEWNDQTEERAYYFSLDTMTALSTDDVLVSNEYRKPIASFSTRLPAVMTLGFAQTSGLLRWAVDWEQGFKRTAESSTKPRLSIGLEWLKLGMMPLRFGFSTGGSRSSSVSFGTGIKARPIYLDVAAVSGTDLSVYSAKGLKLALTTGIRF